MYSRRFLVDKLLGMIKNMTLSYKVEERDYERERERNKAKLLWLFLKTTYTFGRRETHFLKYRFI